MDDKLRLGIDSTQAKQGAAEFDAAIARVERALSRLDRSSEQSLKRVQAIAGRGGFARVAREMADIANVRINPSNVRNWERLSATLSGFRGPNAGAVRRTADLFMILSGLTRFGAGQNLQALAAAVNGFRGPNATQVKNLTSMSAALANLKAPNPAVARRIADLFMVLSSFGRTGATQSIGGISAMLAGMKGPSAAAVRNLQAFAAGLQQMQPPAQAPQIIAVLNAMSRAAANLRSVRFPNFNGAFGNIQSGAFRATGALRGLENQFNASYQAGTLFRSILVSLTVGNFTRSMMEANASVIGFQASMGAFIDDGDEVQRMLDFVGEASNRMGVDVLVAQREFPKLASAMMLSGRSADEARRVFEVWSGAMRVLNLDTMQQRNTFMALQQMFSKGRVSAEELRRQLEQIPGAFNLMQQAIRRRTGDENFNLDAALERGDVRADAALLLTEEMARLYEDRVSMALQKSTAQMTIFKNAFTQFLVQVGQSGADAGLADAFGRVAQAMQSAEFQEFATRLGQSLGNAFRMIGDAAVWAVDNADLVIAAFKTLLAMSIAQSLLGVAGAARNAGLQFSFAATQANAFAIASARGVVSGAATAGRGIVNMASTISNVLLSFPQLFTRAFAGLASLPRLVASAGPAVATGLARIGPAALNAVRGIGPLATTMLPRLVGFLRLIPGLGTIATLAGIAVEGARAAGIFDDFANKGLTFGDIFTGVMGELGENLGKFGQTLGRVFAQGWDRISSFLSLVWNGFKSVMNFLINATVAAVDVVMASFDEAGRSIGGFFSNMAGAVGAAARGDWERAGSMAGDAFTTSLEERMASGQRIADRIARTMNTDRFAQAGDALGGVLRDLSEASGFQEFLRQSSARAEVARDARRAAEAARGQEQQDSGFVTAPIDPNSIDPLGANPDGNNSAARRMQRESEQRRKWLASMFPAVEVTEALREATEKLAEAQREIAAAGLTRDQVFARVRDNLRDELNLLNPTQKAIYDLTLTRERYAAALEAGLISEEEAQRLNQRALQRANEELGLYSEREQALVDYRNRLQELNNARGTELDQEGRIDAAIRETNMAYAERLGVISTTTQALYEYEQQLRNIAQAMATVEGFTPADAGVMQGRAGRSAADALVGASDEGFEQRISALQRLRDEGAITALQYNNYLAEMTAATLEWQVAAGNGTYIDQFLAGLTRMTEGARNAQATLGNLMTEAAQSLSQGLGDSLARAIVYAEDLQSALYNVVNQALTSLISGLIQMGIQMLINQMIGQAAQASATAASAAAGATTASAWAPAAAMVSLASFGANSAPAMTGIATTVGMAQMLAMAGGGMADGGIVTGPGTGTSDSVPRALSQGEFVVNAQSAAANMGLLQQVNNAGGRVISGGGESAPPEVNVRVVNQIDPNDTLAALSSVQGEKLIMNVIGKNGDRIRNLLSR